MKITTGTICRRVYGLLNENEKLLDELTEYCDAGASISTLIEDLIEDAARVVLSTVPAEQIDECRHLEGDTKPVRNMETGAVTVSLPSDFLRLLNVRMSDWNSGISVPLCNGGEEHRLRQNGRHRHPAVAINQVGDRKSLEIYGSGANSYLTELDYVTAPRIEEGKIDIARSVLGDVCAKIAEFVKSIIES